MLGHLSVVQDRTDRRAQDRTGHARQDMRDRTCETGHAGQEITGDGRGREMSTAHDIITGQDRIDIKPPPHHTTPHSQLVASTYHS